MELPVLLNPENDIYPLSVPSRNMKTFTKIIYPRSALLLAIVMLVVTILSNTS